MTQNISGKVSSCLDNDFVIRRALLRNIVSLRALARHLIGRLGLQNKNMDAVISAIRRYKRTETEESAEKLRKLFSRLSVKTRSDIVDIRIYKNKKNFDNLSRLNSIVDIERGEILRIIQAEQAIKVIIDDKNMEKFNAIFGRQDYISMGRRLVEVNLQFSDEAQAVKGILAMVTSSLNAEGINIVEIMSCAPELLLIVRKDDLIKVLGVIDNLSGLF